MTRQSDAKEKKPFWAILRRTAPPSSGSPAELAMERGPSAFNGLFGQHPTGQQEQHEPRQQPGEIIVEKPIATIATHAPSPSQPVHAPPPLSDASTSQSPRPDPELKEFSRHHKGARFLTPTDLSRSSSTPRRVALIGSCFLSAWDIHGRNKDSCKFDIFTVNHGASLPEQPVSDGDAPAYDFQIIQIPLRSIFPDDLLTKIPYDDIAAHHQALEDTCKRLAFQLQRRLQWNLSHGIPAFVANFPLPQKNLFGSLFARYDIRNPEHFIYCLNEKLEATVRSYKGAYILDIDRICAAFGRRYIQDDILSTVSHNSIIGTLGAVRDRIEPMDAMSRHYEVEWGTFLADAIWAEALCMFRVLRQDDAVKMVIVDLDDTLWNGVSGDIDHVDANMLTGWPEGLTEALVYLKKRGVLLAIASKNEESRIREIWPKIFNHRLSLEDFSIVRINWRPKIENIAEILSLVNLLPRNIVFIDDNPAERAAVQKAFPEIRLLGRHPYYFRRILLWSSETQGVSITSESRQRTEMVQAQITREGARADMSRDAFLADAAPKVTLTMVVSVEDTRFPRTIELVNKTNQFNTTGERWTQTELSDFFSTAGELLVFDVADRFTSYGLVGAVFIRGNCIHQWVMSCRVLGLDIELAVMCAAIQRMRASGHSEIVGRLIATDANFPCRDLFAKSGFLQDGEIWRLPPSAIGQTPTHVTLIDNPSHANG